MKKSEDYLKEQNISEFILTYLSGMLQPDGISGNFKQRILNSIKQAQIDAIQETAKQCAKHATTKAEYKSNLKGSKYKTWKDWEEIDYTFTTQRFLVDKQSILSIATKLIKEL